MQNLPHYLENPLKGFAGKTIDEVSAFEEKLGSEEHISYGSRTYEVKTSFDGEYQRTYFFYDYADESMVGRVSTGASIGSDVGTRILVWGSATTHEVRAMSPPMNLHV